jgi:hypothetical protein
MEVPNLVAAHSGSSSSRTPSTLDASTVSHLSSNKKKRSHKKNYHQSGNDSSILRGVEILRRQILQSDDSLDDDEALLLGPDHCFSNDILQRMDSLEPHDEDDGENNDEDGSQSSSDDWIDARVSTDNTPEMFIHRNGTLRTKVETYIVQRVDEMDTSTFDSSFDDGSLLHLTQLGSDERSYLPGGFAPSSPARVPVLDTSQTSSGSPFVLTRKFEDISFPTDSRSHALDLLTDLAQSKEMALHETFRQKKKKKKKRSTKRDRNICTTALLIVEEPSPCDHIVPPRTPQYEALMKDPGFLHAQRAGTLWQSLVSQHVRFSSKWWNGARSPPMGVAERRMWNYVGRHRVKESHILNGLVRNRGSPGRLLLHVVVRDIITGIPVLDIAIGCFHPSARGVRTTSASDPSLEECRNIWVALRRRVDDISVIESLLKRNEDDDIISESPLMGGKHAVDNNNMRAIFGETPPVHTVLVAESEVYELFSHHLDGHTPPAAILLQRFLKDW